ncbi:putative membrane protein YpjA [Halarchaeum rubridurum]|uniref:Putative membrane protein YpjA n=1 Tax=Halarchaeum rubridurum TaxID=489911 RepID=A0A830FM32_9EURY|nr:DUF1405 domain-containing protein [Halarchaeum rubridurum]MBP1953650.1 putative membrane protein YpjA [Halarchaeum rubridurum]GGM63701.1 hypothetical protein GCM10009017_12140 [Halarchaeum rubridurum]
MWTPLPERVAAPYLDVELSRVLLLCANAVGVLVGLNFYLEQMTATPVLAWPLLIDSPLSLCWLAASLLTLWGLGRRYYPSSPFLDVLNTLAFASMVKYGLWTAFTLNYFFGAYYPDVWSYWGILFTHLVMVAEAFLLPYYGRTSRFALVVTACWFAANDVADYVFGLHPHLQSATTGPLPWVTPLLSLGALALAWYCLDGGRDDPTTL